MTEEIKDSEVSEEGEKVKSEAPEENKEPENAKDEFEKEEEFVPSQKYNQAVRKQREMELEKRELQKQLEEAKKEKEVPKKEEKSEEKSSFFDEVEEEEDEAQEAKPESDPTKIIDEKLKPVLENLKKREENDRKIQRSAFFEAHPQYLKDSEKWQELLDEMERSINPNSSDDYITQLNKAHLILTGEQSNVVVEKKTQEMASDASSGGDEAIKSGVKEEFTAEDRKYMKDWDVSEEGMRAFKKKVASGDMKIL